MITLTTEQAQQIEEALAFAASHSEYLADDLILYGEALATIRTARAQEQAKQEPVAWMVTSEGLDGTPKTYPLTGRFKDVCDMCDFGDPIPLYAAPVQQAEQEPVAVYLGHTASMGDVFRLEKQIPVGTKLYATPVRTKDLTADEIVEIMKQPFNQRKYLEQFARAVIAADREKNRG